MQARLLKKSESGNSGSKLSLGKQKRRVFAAGLVALTLATFGWDVAFNHSIAANHQRLYIGWSLPEKASATPSVEQRILACLEEGSKSQKAKSLIGSFSHAVERHDREAAVGELHLDINLSSRRTAEDEAAIHIELGQIYLEQMWPDSAVTKFQHVLSAIPPGKPQWGKSFARQSARYGLARAHMLQSAYNEALSELKQAPGEYNTGCGNANAAEADDNYPLEVVWTAAIKPLPEAERILQPIMRGRFTPRKSEFPISLIDGTSEDQRKHAAAEAGLTLGCLYYQAGRFAEARACWDLVASPKNSQGESRLLADALLKRMASLSFDEG
jgi:tetratricopeptide (TPR) repeat protein